MSAASDAGSVRVICGPTAAGKSSIALALAREHGAAIISADSRQIYRRFDIGTAKPARDDLSLVPHFCIDVADPEQRYSAAEWAARARDAIETSRAAGRIPLVVGGTGFYLRALFDPLFEQPPIDARRRAELEAFLEVMRVDELRRYCAQLDPRRAHLGRTQLIRAIQIALLCGKRLSTLHDRARPAVPPLRARYLVLDPGAALADRIERRVDVMLNAGWADEVSRLSETVAEDAPAWKSTGYGVIRELVRGTVDERSARERVIIQTRQYAKRQRTWFRHQLGNASVDRLSPVSDQFDDRLAAWWRKEDRE